MERLTKRESSGIVPAVEKEIICSNYCNSCSQGAGNCETVKDMVERLEAIEDILGDSYNIDRLRELVKADRDGRYVVLPVKEGDIVYHIIWDLFEDYPPEIVEYPFSIRDYDEIGNSVFLTEEDAEAALEERNKKEKRNGLQRLV